MEHDEQEYNGNIDRVVVADFKQYYKQSKKFDNNPSNFNLDYKQGTKYPLYVVNSSGTRRKAKVYEIKEAKYYAELRAKEIMCKRQGLDWVMYKNQITGDNEYECIHNKKSCLSASVNADYLNKNYNEEKEAKKRGEKIEPMNLEFMNYLEWHPEKNKGKGACVVSNYIYRRWCEDSWSCKKNPDGSDCIAGALFTKHTAPRLSYNASNGKCSITKEYCNKLCHDFDPDTQDCYMPDAQKVAGMLLGGTLTCAFRKVGEEIGSNPADLALGIATGGLYTAGVAAGQAIAGKEVTGSAMNFDDSHTSGGFGDTEHQRDLDSL